MFFLHEEQIAEEHFPKNWDNAILLALQRHGRETVLSGDSPTSIRRGDPSRVTILDGDQIAERLPWLSLMYETVFLNAAKRLSQRQLYIATERQFGINANLLDGPGAHYETHRDSNPVTGLLFVNNLSSTVGGDLVFETVHGDVRLRPRKGIFIVFDARDTVHYVSPLQAPVYRLSLPMNFYESEREQFRPAGLNEYLYRT